jgi:hypothetical protein
MIQRDTYDGGQRDGKKEAVQVLLMSLKVL